MTSKLKEYFPMIQEREKVLERIQSNRYLRILFSRWETERQEEFLDFCTGMRGIKILYDSFFKDVLNPEYAPERLDSFLSALLKKKEGKEKELEFATVQVPSVLPRIVLLPKKDDTQEVILLEEIIERNIHKLLLSGARGKDKNPGEFRNDQNWIGKHGRPIEEASFVPVSPEKLIDNLENLEFYINKYEEQSALIQAAIIHVQFEKIHPFKDGNGRIGRMLIPLFLYYKGVISRPILYISEFLEENREEYYEKLNEVSENEQGWMEWIEFFLNAVETQANRNIERIKKLQNLYSEYKIKINETLNSKNSIYVVDALFKIPVFRSTKLQEEISKSVDIDMATVNRYIKKMVDAGIIVPEEGKDRYVKYYFKKLVDFAK